VAKYKCCLERMLSDPEYTLRWASGRFRCNTVPVVCTSVTCETAQVLHVKLDKKGTSVTCEAAQELYKCYM
jgi:hypothetical protein